MMKNLCKKANEFNDKKLFCSGHGRRRVKLIGVQPLIMKWTDAIESIGLDYHQQTLWPHKK